MQIPFKKNLRLRIAGKVTSFDETRILKLQDFVMPEPSARILSFSNITEPEHSLIQVIEKPRFIDEVENGLNTTKLDDYTIFSCIVKLGKYVACHQQSQNFQYLSQLHFFVF